MRADAAIPRHASRAAGLTTTMTRASATHYARLYVTRGLLLRSEQRMLYSSSKQTREVPSEEGWIARLREHKACGLAGGLSDSVHNEAQVTLEPYL